MKTIFATGVFLTVFLAGAYSQEATPEQEIQRFFDQYNADSFDGLMAMFAVDSYLEKYSSEDQISFNHMFEPQTGLLPNTTNTYRGINLYTKQYYVARQLKRFELALIDRKLFGAFGNQAVNAGTPDEVARIETLLNTKPAAKIQVVAIREPVDPVTLKRAKGLWKSHSKVYHVDEILEKVVLIAIGAKTYMTSFQLWRYGMKYFISQLSSDMASIGAGDVFEYSLEDFNSNYPQ